MDGNIKWVAENEQVEFRGLNLPGPILVADGPMAPCIALNPALPVERKAPDVSVGPTIPELCTYKEMSPATRFQFLQYLLGREKPSYAFLKAEFLWIEWLILIHARSDRSLLFWLQRLLEKLDDLAHMCDLAAWITELLHFASHRLGPEAYLKFWDGAKAWPGLRWGQGALSYFLTNSLMAGRPIPADIAAKLASIGHRFEWGWSWWKVPPGEEFTKAFIRRFEQRFPSGFSLKLSPFCNRVPDPNGPPEWLPADPFVSMVYLPKHWETIRACGAEKVSLHVELNEFFPSVEPGSNVHPDLRLVLDIAADCKSELQRQY